MAELVGDHADLSAVVSFVGEHVGEHLRASGPGLGPSVAEEVGDGWVRAEGFREHPGAGGGALGQGSGDGLRRGGAGEQGWARDVRGGETEPLEADVVDVGEDGGDGAGVGRGTGLPEAGAVLSDVIEKKLECALVDGEETDCGELGIGPGHTDFCFWG